MNAQFIAWLDATQLSTLFKVTSWVVPTVQSIHILAIGVVLASGLLIALRLLGLSGRHLEIVALGERLLPSIWWAALVLLVTGLILIVAEPTRTLNNPFFFAKVACLLVLVPLTRCFQLSLRKAPVRWSAAAVPPRTVRPLAATAMLLLLAVIFCGRWIAYA